MLDVSRDSALQQVVTVRDFDDALAAFYLRPHDDQQRQAKNELEEIRSGSDEMQTRIVEAVDLSGAVVTPSLIRHALELLLTGPAAPRTLRHLRMECCGIAEDALRAVMDAVCHCAVRREVGEGEEIPMHPVLDTLDLSYNALGDSDVAALADALWAASCAQQQQQQEQHGGGGAPRSVIGTLVLRGNSFSNDALRTLLEARTGLLELDVSFVTTLEHEGLCGQLCDALLVHPTLRRLHLGGFVRGGLLTEDELRRVAATGKSNVYASSSSSSSSSASAMIGPGGHSGVLVVESPLATRSNLAPSKTTGPASGPPNTHGGDRDDAADAEGAAEAAAAAISSKLMQAMRLVGGGCDSSDGTVGRAGECVRLHEPHVPASRSSAPASRSQSPQAVEHSPRTAVRRLERANQQLVDEIVEARVRIAQLEARASRKRRVKKSKQGEENTGAAAQKNTSTAAAVGGVKLRPATSAAANVRCNAAAGGSGSGARKYVARGAQRAVYADPATFRALGGARSGSGSAPLSAASSRSSSAAVATTFVRRPPAASATGGSSNSTRRGGLFAVPAPDPHMHVVPNVRREMF